VTQVLRRIVAGAASSLTSTILAVLGLSLAAITVTVAVFAQTIVGAIALYFVVWWIALFAVLPFGVRSQAEAGEITAGTEPGAPIAPALREKAIWTSALAMIVLIAVAWLRPLAGL
jgi:predicted secreted protein